MSLRTIIIYWNTFRKIKFLDKPWNYVAKIRNLVDGARRLELFTEVAII